MIEDPDTVLNREHMNRYKFRQKTEADQSRRRLSRCFGAEIWRSRSLIQKGLVAP